MNLSNKVEIITKEIELNESKLASINAESQKLAHKKEKLNESARKIQGRMYKGEVIDDELKDFCFFHYGTEMKEKFPQVKAFFDEIKKYAGQSLLINYEGNDWTSTQIVDGRMNSGRNERSIELARLLTPAYQVIYPERGLLANALQKRRFVNNQGWKKYDGKISLSGFLFEFVNMKQSPMADAAKVLLEALAKSTPVQPHFIPEPEGLRIGISSPIITDFSQLPIGGSTTYDSEPHVYLIIGDKAVNHYLSQQKLTVKKVEESAAIIPQI